MECSEPNDRQEEEEEEGIGLVRRRKTMMMMTRPSREEDKSSDSESSSSPVGWSRDSLSSALSSDSLQGELTLPELLIQEEEEERRVGGEQEEKERNVLNSDEAGSDNGELTTRSFSLHLSSPFLSLHSLSFLS